MRELLRKLFNKIDTLKKWPFKTDVAVFNLIVDKEGYLHTHSFRPITRSWSLKTLQSFDLEDPQ